MNLNFLCCIGAELKNSVQQTTRMTQVYLYRAFEEETIADMLATGFFNDALGIIRQDDLLLLYSPNETPGKYVYARVSSVGRDGVEIEKVNIRAEEIQVDTTGYTNLSGNNLQQILNNLDTLLTTINNAFVKKDGTSIMTGPLKFRAGSFEGAIAGGLGDGISIYKLKADGSIDSEVASLTKTNGFVPGTNNAMDIGRNNFKWKDAHIARVITAIINNGYDIGVPATSGPDTLALKSEVDNAANSGRMITDQGVWYAKMYAASVVPTGAEYDGTNYADFSQTDGEGNPVIKIYTGASGAWTLTDTITPPANYDGYVPVTKKIWDIMDQVGQQGGRILWNHQSKQFTPYPSVVSFEDIEITGESTVDMPLNPVPQQIVNKDYVDTATAAFLAGKANVGMDNLTSTGKNIANWSSNVTNCITEIPNDTKLELNSGTLTLKAGSKVYVPNGVDTFDVITIASDLTIDGGSGGFSGSGTLYYNYTNSVLAWYASSTDASGTTPLSTSNFYNTSTNTVYRYRNNVQGAQLSFPLAHITITNDVITNIDQVFNGLGHIGTAVFVLPGISALIPNGLNSDGSCKNIAFTNPSVSVYNDPTTIERNIGFVLDSSGNIINNENSKTENTFIGLAKERPTTVADNYSHWWYSIDENQWYNTSGSTTANWQKAYPVFLGKRNGTATTTTYFEPNYAFQALDYSNSEYIANCAMPSNKHIDLTLGASGTNYTAPADGVFVVILNASGSAWCNMSINNNTVAAFSTNSGPYYNGYFSVSKGDILKLEYSNCAKNRFMFVYANGAV